LCNLGKSVTLTRKGAHLEYGVNTDLYGEDELKSTQTSQNINMTSGPNGIALCSEEGKRLIALISVNSVIIVFIVLLI